MRLDRVRSGGRGAAADPARKRALDFTQRLVAAHSLGCAHLLLREAGADHVDAIERRLGGDLLLTQREVEAGILDREFEVLGDLVLVDDATGPHADLPRAAQVAALHHRADLLELLRRRLEERLSPVGAKLAELRVAARHQALAGEEEQGSRLRHGVPCLTQSSSRRRGTDGAHAGYPGSWGGPDLGVAGAPALGGLDYDRW